jgi:hypothetical protein
MFLTLSSCGLLKRVTTERVVIVTQIDTVLKINIDGYKPLTDTRPMTDTAKVESKTGISIAYVNPINSRVTVQFLPKTFDVPVVINQKIKEYKKQVEPMGKLILKALIIFLSFAVFFLGFLIWWLDRKIKKYTKIFTK